MSKEAMRLALEHAKRDERHINHAETRYWCRMYRDIAEKAIEALAEQPYPENFIDALKYDAAKRDFWEGYVPEPDKRQQALDKMAENARELGLDYEPAQQEPEYAWPTVADYERDVGFQTNEAFRIAWNMARTTNRMLGHTSSQPAQRTWLGLTDDEIDQGLLRSDYAFKTAEAWRAGVVFAMTKLKEKNT